MSRTVSGARYTETMSEAPSPDSLVKAISFEIEEIRAKQTRAGWTPWAMALAATGAASLALELCANGQNYLHVAAALVAWSFGADLAAQLVAFSGPSIGGDGTPRVYDIQRFVGDSGPEVVTRTVRGTVVLMGVLILGPMLDRWVFGFMVYFAVADLLAPYVLMALAGLGLHIAFGGKTARGLDMQRPLLAGAWASLLGKLLVLAAFVEAVARQRLGEVSSVKLGFLLVVVMILLEQLAKASQHAPTTNLLRALRRQVLLGQRSVDQAVAEFEEAIEGQKLQQFVGRETEALLVGERSLRNGLAEIASEVGRCEAAVAAQDLPVAKGLVERIAVKMTGLRANQAARSKALRRLRRRLTTIGVFADVSSYLPEVKARLEVEIVAQNKEADRLSKRLEAILQAVKDDAVPADKVGPVNRSAPSARGGEVGSPLA